MDMRDSILHSPDYHIHAKQVISFIERNSTRITNLTLLILYNKINTGSNLARILKIFFKDLIKKHSLFAANVTLIWRVPDFGGWFFPICGQEKYKFLLTNARTLLNEHILNQFYIRICVQIFNQLFCLLFKLLLRYVLITTFKSIYSAHWHICILNCQWCPFKTAKLTMTAIQNIQISNA